MPSRETLIRQAVLNVANFSVWRNDNMLYFRMAVERDFVPAWFRSDVRFEYRALLRRCQTTGAA